MRTKPVWAATGMLLSGALLSGCSFSRNFYEGGHPPPTPASVSYSQVPGWTAQPARAAASAYQPVVTPAAASTKADGPMEVTTSLQLVNGTTGAANPTPMLTITLPAVKFLVPVTGSYSFGGPNGENSMAATATNPDANVHTVNQAAPTSPSTIQYVVPATTAVQPTVQYTPGQPAATPPQHLPAFNPPASTTPPAVTPKAEETSETKSAPAAADPTPNWPAEAASSEPASPPPPPPISRPPVGLPKGQ